MVSQTNGTWRRSNVACASQDSADLRELQMRPPPCPCSEALHFCLGGFDLELTTPTPRPDGNLKAYDRPVMDVP
ncbi:calcium/calmodulin-dependent serine protein kinase 1 [Plakobranchus ocellatus]|uniref:Calcium/calmodulin-dependent serine protein kinase 1 n=1 Tax=Plakobranchus ocellatus TaxID=259542 RepID=A0AAV4CHD4_9GAST|nr:calcium/calmodulin-dependent serine protein kinase 1 [Plakobranchus ocellatus]